MAYYDDYDYGYGRGNAYGTTRQGGHKDRQTEINEAIMAGERALEALKQAQNDLGTARIAGVVDLIGGGFLTNLFKTQIRFYAVFKGFPELLIATVNRLLNGKHHPFFFWGLINK